MNIESMAKDREAFNRHIRRHALDIMDKSIPGGMMGGYMEPGFPLYFIDDQMLRYLGYTYESFVEAIDGQVINCMHPDDRERVERLVELAFSQGPEYEVQYRMITRRSGYIWVNDIGKKDVSEDGRPVCISVVRDITEEVEAKNRLQDEARQNERQAQRYNHLLRSMLCGIVQFQHDIILDKVVYYEANPEAIRIFGYTEEEFWQHGPWTLTELVVPEDLDGLMREVVKLQHVGDKIQFEYRVLQKNGSHCWIIGTSELIRNMDGNVVVQSVYLDINQKKEAELQNQILSEQVQAGNELLRLALENTSVYEFYYYPQKRLLVCPQRTQSRFGGRARQENVPEYFDSRISDPSYSAMYEAIIRGEKTASCIFRCPAGQLWCRATLSNIQWSASGEPELAVGVIEDITQAKETELALEASRSRDPLTGTFSRENGVHMVREYMAQKPPDEFCTIMLLDMDDFDAVNEEEGRAFADIILQEVADILRAQIGDDGILVRLGGDEFLIFIKRCDRKRAGVLGKGMAEHIRNLFQDGDKTLSISASIGMCCTEVVDEYTGLYRCAESTLQYVKEHGKGHAACYLDSSQEMGTMLTEMYTGEHMVNVIDSKNGNPDSSLLDYALELLGKAKKLDDAIYLLLGKVGKQCGLDRVSILEANADFNSLRYSYQWARHRSDIQTDQSFYLTAEEYAVLTDQYDEDGLCDHRINPSNLMPSVLHAAFWNRGSFAGSFAFESRLAAYTWTDEHRKLVKELSKILATFIMKARADAVSQAKTDFLSRMSHEIRTPMNAIAGMTTIAKTVLDNKDKALDCLNKIEMSNQYLVGLINDILDMSRIESGKIELNLDSVLLEDVGLHLQELLRPQAEAKGLALEFDPRFRPGRPVLLDELRFNQVFINIVGNAIKFTNPGGQILARASLEKQTDTTIYVRFSVKDTGVGISPEAKTRIFNAFEQENRSTAARYGGTGLGLSISDRLVRMMGGVLNVESEVGKGSEFYFTLPLRYGEDSQTNRPSKPEAVKKMDFTGKRLLLAEDNELNREIAVTLLQMNGFEVETAANGARAVESFVNSPAGRFDAILMDIRMPVMDGLEATKRIRSTDKPDAKTIPIIAMTANAFDEDAKISMECGMNGHLTKPLDTQRLFGTLAACFSARPQNGR